MVFQNTRNKIDAFFESKCGHWFIGTLVIINAIILGAQTFKAIPLQTSLLLHHIDQIILAVFIFEIVIKLLTNGVSFFKKAWNVFDFIIITTAFIYHLDFLPILRAFRVLHLMSLMDAAPKMLHIISGLWKAIPGILHVFFIVVLFFYISSVLGVFLYRDTGVPQFQHIGVAMEAMFQILTGDNWSDIMREVEKHSPFAWIYFIGFYIVMGFIVINLFIGVVVNAFQAAEEEVFPKDKGQDTEKLILSIKKKINTVEQKIDALMSQNVKK
jgi:voltage-gated sodium channel